MSANYGCNPQNSKGRIFNEPENKYRDCYQRDRDRIIHSSAFRKLVYKTQVFINYEGDYYRTRLTHSLEVSQIARSIARRLNVNEDLTEAIALAHDIGHPPFGHAGEDALKNMTKNYHEFDHNAQALRILTELEAKHIQFDGLNLTWETLEGLVKHNGPINSPHESIKKYDEIFDFQLGSYSSIEAQIAGLSDDIAYNAHDIDDGLRSKLIKIEDVVNLPIIRNHVDKDILVRDVNIQMKMIYQALRKMIAFLINDVIEVTLINIKKYSIKTSLDVRNLSKNLAHFSDDVQKDLWIVKKFLFENLYHNYKINRIRSKVMRIVRDLFEVFFNEPHCLPTEWSGKIKMHIDNNDKDKAQVISDFISGMTDRFAIKEHQRLFDSYTLLEFNA